jgi:hypothetical protein
MAVHKIIELSSTSTTGWEDAAQKAIDEASRSINGIKSIYVRDFVADVENNKITNYQVHAKVTFEVER